MPPLGLAARSRVQASSGRWLLLYGTQLSSGADGRTAGIIQPAPVNEIAPIVALAYGLSERERQVTQLYIEGRSTKQIARALHVSHHTVQDHLEAIFAETGVRTRGELVGQVFLEHYVPRWETHPQPPDGWHACSCGAGVGRRLTRAPGPGSASRRSAHELPAASSSAMRRSAACRYDRRAVGRAVDALGERAHTSFERVGVGACLTDAGKR